MRFVHAAVLTLVLAACNRAEDSRTDEAAPGSDAQHDGNGAQRTTISQPEALGVLRAITAAEISAAQVAQQLSANSAITAYAGVIIADHQGIAELIDSAAARLGQTPRDNVLSTSIRLQGDSIARSLGVLTTGGFNNTFIEEQVRTHQEALQLLDTLLIPSARDSSVKHLLNAIRPAIAAHMQRAMQILSQRRQDAADRGEQWVSGFQHRSAPAAAPATAPPQVEPVPQPQPEPAQPPQREPPPEPRDTLSEDTIVGAPRHSPDADSP